MLCLFNGSWDYDGEKGIGTRLPMRINPAMIELAVQVDGKGVWYLLLNNHSVYVTKDEFQKLLDATQVQLLTPKPVTITEVVVKQ